MEQTIKNNTEEIFNNQKNLYNLDLQLELYPSQAYMLWDGVELGIKVESERLVIYEADKSGQFTKINISIPTKDIFSDLTKNKLEKFILKYTNTKKDDFGVNRILDKFYTQYQEVLNFEKEQNEINLKSQKEQIQKEYQLQKQREEEEIKLFKSKKPKDLLDIISTWEKLFATYSNSNKEYSNVSLHLLLGQCIIGSRLGRLGLDIDPRISIMYFKPSGTGGSAGYNIVAKVADELGLKCNTVSSATDAAMIGSVETTINDAGEKETEEIKGLLDKSRSNIIYWAEPEGLFEKNNNQHEGNIRRYIQSGLNLIDDRESTLSRDMKNGSVKAKCEASIMLATVPPQSITDKVIDSGLMQRFCFINKTIEIDERIQNAMWDINNVDTIDNFGNIDKKNKLMQEKLTKEIVEKLKYLIVWGNTHQEYAMTQDVKKYFNIQEYKMFKEIGDLKNVTDRVKEKMASFQQFTVRRAEQLSMHRAALRFSTTIELEDIQYVFEGLIRPQMKTMLTYLESNWLNEVVGKKEQTEEEILKQKYGEIVVDPRGIKKSEFIELMSKTFKKSTDTIYRKYKKYIENKILIEKKDEKEIYITFVGDVLFPDINNFDKKETPYQGTTKNENIHKCKDCEKSYSSTVENSTRCPTCTTEYIAKLAQKFAKAI